MHVTLVMQSRSSNAQHVTIGMQRKRGPQKAPRVGEPWTFDAKRIGWPTLLSRPRYWNRSPQMQEVGALEGGMEVKQEDRESGEGSTVQGTAQKAPKRHQQLHRTSGCKGKKRRQAMGQSCARTCRRHPRKGSKGKKASEQQRQHLQAQRPAALKLTCLKTLKPESAPPP